MKTAINRYLKKPLPNGLYKPAVPGRKLDLDDSDTLHNKNGDALYDLLEQELTPETSDERILEIFSNFNQEDYQHGEIICDLVINKRIAILAWLYDKKVSLTYSDPSRANILHLASAISGSLEAVKFLFERNIYTDVNAQTDEKETPFLLAVMYEHADILKYFFKHAKPDLTIGTIYGDTAFSLAQKTGNKKIISLIDDYAKSVHFKHS